MLEGHRVCLVEDDQALAEVLADYLGRQGLEVAVVGNGPDAVEHILGARPDVVLLDVGLPGFDGFEVCRRIRPAYRGPVLMLTARVEDIDEIIGLEVGADDYLKKPVKPRVLLARMRATLRRGGAEASDEGRRVFGDVVVDAGRREVLVAGRDADLTTAEFDLLWALVTRAGTVVTRDDLHRELRGVEYDGVDRSIDLRVSRVRKKLGDEAGNRIRSVRGAGYQWAAER